MLDKKAQAASAPLPAAGKLKLLLFFCLLRGSECPKSPWFAFCAKRVIFRRDTGLCVSTEMDVLFQHDFSHSGFFVAFNLQQIDSTWQVGEVDFLLLGLE